MQSCSSPIPAQVSSQRQWDGTARLAEAEPGAHRAEQQGLVCPCPGSTCMEARLPVKLCAGEKQTLLGTASRRRAEAAGVLQTGGCFPSVRDLAGS